VGGEMGVCYSQVMVTKEKGTYKTADSRVASKSALLVPFSCTMF
jgi:hypothetical protein